MKLLLSESLNILQSIVDSMDAGIFVLDRELRIQAVNTKASRWLARDVAGSPHECYREIHGKGHPCENCPTLRTFESGKTERLEMKLERAGKSRYYFLTASPLRLEKGQEFSYVVETVQDITAEKSAAEEISRLNDFNKAIIDNAPVAIFTLDRHGTFTSVNPALALISGLGSEAEAKLIGFNWLKNPLTIKSGLAAHLKRGAQG